MLTDADVRRTIDERVSVRLSPHFTLGEMVRTQHPVDNWPPTATIVRALEALCLNALEPVRTHFGLAVFVNSGFRSKALNDKLPGASLNSQHLLGEAADIEAPPISNLVLARFIVENGAFDQVILEHHVPGDPASGWVHVSWALPRRIAAHNRVLTKFVGDNRFHRGLLEHPPG